MIKVTLNKLENLSRAEREIVHKDLQFGKVGDDGALYLSKIKFEETNAVIEACYAPGIWLSFVRLENK